MSIVHKFVGPFGYKKVNYNEISEWAQSKCRNYQKRKYSGYAYFVGKRYMYAVYYHSKGDYTIFRKKK